MAGVEDGEFDSSGVTAFTFHLDGHVRQVAVNDEEYASDDDSMPELEDRGDISSSDDESDDEDVTFVTSDGATCSNHNVTVRREWLEAKPRLLGR